MQVISSIEQGRVPVTVFHISGEINSNTYEQFIADARQAHGAGAQNMLVDLADVRYVSSAGIRALSTIFKFLRTDAPNESTEAMRTGLNDGTFKSPHLKLLNPQPSVLEVLRMAGIDMFLDIHDDLNTAIASF